MAMFSLMRRVKPKAFSFFLLLNLSVASCFAGFGGWFTCSQPVSEKWEITIL